MSSQSRIEIGLKRPVLLTLLVAAVGGTLGGCSDIYYDRRETVALGADDHIAVNRVAQMVDPWPVYVGNKNIAFDGQRMQAAAERYRKHEVIRPVPLTTNTYSQPQTPAPVTTEAISIPQAATMSAPAAAVK
jgi:hypothetical protein